MIRLTGFDYCRRCSAGPLCAAANTPSSCWHLSAYPLGSRHPRRDVVRPQRIEAPSRWGRVPSESQFLPVLDRPRKYGLSEFAYAHDVGIRYLRGKVGGDVPVACFLMSNDADLERLWNDSPNESFGVTVVAASFSTWDDAPPFEHCHESVRSAELAARLARQGPVVPAIPLSDYVDMTWWLEFLEPARPADIAVDLWAKAGAWSDCARRLSVVAEVLRPLGARLISYRVSSPQRLKDVKEIWPGAVLFASRAPIDRALFGGQRIVDVSLRAVQDRGAARSELVVHNVEAFRAGVARLLGED